MISVTNNAEKTSASYFGVVEKTTAIFIQSGSTNIGDHLISLMVNDICNIAVRLDRPTLHYEFLEEFIRNRDLPSKEDWVEYFRHEYKYAITVPIFPRELTIVFVKALRELKNNMTLEQIRQLKKMLK